MNENLENEEIVKDKYDQYIPEHPKRKHVYNKFYSLLSKYANDTTDAKKKALNIERGIFNYTINTYRLSVCETWNEIFYNRYILRVVIIYNNLNPEGYLQNKYLIKKLVDDEINEFDLCNYTAEQLFPDRAAELQHMYKTEIEIFGLDKTIEDGIVKCGKCKGYKVTYYEMQTRSADEITTKFAQCHNCGHRFKFY